jgi:Putative peptidoglycan binding domain
MGCKRWIRSALVGLLAVALVLCAPSAGFAAPPEDASGVLARGAGYGTPQGSPDVRAVQRLLRRLGDDPGPIDGLYGPLTAAAVLRFQQENGLVVDGVVGPQTRGRLAAERRSLGEAKLERKSPARTNPAESAIEQPAPRPTPEPARPPDPGQPPTRAPAEAGSDMAPLTLIAGIVAGLAVILLLVLTWRLARRRLSRPRAGPRLGLVTAAVLGAFAIGAASGAVFVSEASPDEPEARTR